MKRVVISSFITLVILALIAIAYFYLQRYSIVTTDPVNGIPPNSVFFIEAKGAKNVLKKLSSENLWSCVTNADSTANENLKFLDSALSSHPETKEIWEKKNIYVSAHLTKANSFDYLYLANVPTAWSDEKTNHFISQAFHPGLPAGRRVYENVVVHELHVSADKNFSFAITKGVFVGSFTSFLIDDAIRQVKSGGSVNKSKSFSKVAASAGENTDASMYVNYISLREFFSAFCSGGNPELFTAIGSFARWSKLDATVQNNGLAFHGLTASTDTADFVIALRNQQPQRMDVAEILPSRSALFIRVGLSDYQEYFHHLLFNSVYFDPAHKRMQTLSILEEKFDVEIEKNLTGWIGNEITLVVTEPGSASFENNSYACIRANDIESASASLLLVQNAVNGNTAPAKTEEYRKHSLGYINLAGFVPLCYSKLFSNITRFYYTTAGSYVVIANQPAALRSFIDDFEENKTLAEDPAFKNVLRNAERTSNFFLYLNFERAKNIFRHYASDQLARAIDKNQTILNRFSAFTFQLVNRNEKIATTVQLLQSKEKINDANLLWSAQLDTAVTMAPFVITNSETKKDFVVVQDENKNLYMIDDAGNVSWKKNLPEKIISGFHMVDAYKNGQLQILFNTPSQLYLLDLDGNDYGNYPIHLPATATNGCEVFDFDQSKNYKIFIACSNRVIYAYEISGKPMNGWLFNQPVSDVTKPVQNFNVKDKNYILIYNTSGTVFLLDKKGATRAALRQTFVAGNSTFSLIPGDSLEEDHLVTTDTSGKIISIYFNGVVTSKSYGHYSAEHAFTATDVDGDGRYDYVFLDHHQLNVITQDNAVIYYHIFMENIVPSIHSFYATSSLKQLGFGSADADKFYLVNSDGKISNGFPVKGFTGFAINGWGPEGKRILVTSGAGGIIYLYNLE